MSELKNIKDIVVLISRLQILCEGFDDLNKNSVLRSKVKVLLEISSQPNTSPNKIKSKVGLAKSNLTLLCNTLINEQLIVKQKDKIDNRAIYYNITPKGQEYLDGVLQQMKKNFEGELAYKNNYKQIDLAVKNLLELIY